MADDGASFSFSFDVGGQEGAAGPSDARAAANPASRRSTAGAVAPAVEERDTGVSGALRGAMQQESTCQNSIACSQDASTRGFEDVEIAHGLSLLKGCITGAETAALVGDNRVEANDLVRVAWVRMGRHGASMRRACVRHRPS
jgi:hypothetical protein